MKVLISADVSEAHRALKQRFGGRKQPYAMRRLVGWSDLDQSSSSAININHIAAEVNSLTKQLNLLYNNKLNDGDYLRTAPSIEDQMAMKTAMKTATKPITLKDSHYEIGLP